MLVDVLEEQRTDRMGSSYERWFLTWLSNNDSVSGLKSNVITEYDFEGKRLKYFVDYGVKFVDGTSALYEVKSEYMKDNPKNVAKFSAVIANLPALGYDRLEVITENSLKELGV